MDAAECNRREILASASLALIAGAAPAGAKARTSHVRELLELLQLKREVYRTGNVSLLEQFYLKDAFITGEGMGVVHGIAAIQSAFAKILPNRSDAELVPVRSAFPRGSRMGYQFIYFTPVSREPRARLRTNTLLLIWERRSVGWRCSVEVDLHGPKNVPAL